MPLPDDVQTIGYFLTVFDDSLVKWSQLVLGSASARDQNMLRVLEANMQERARKRLDELLGELESGAPLNRRIAAAALGFAHEPRVLGPLLSTLAEPDPELVQRALLGIGVLAMPDTPVGEIQSLLLNDGDTWTRNNAAFALLGLARAGSTASELPEACRAALSDADPGVRAQCASALGELADPAAVGALSELLADEANLVALASALSLARIGREHAEQRGATARALAGALDRVRTDRRAHVLGALRWLHRGDLGEDARPWREWAHKLP
ncbi:MAG: HEAT repeat domain-containing protein [Planctomycetes bacterium]|nr:HEAT repeat domain-containing protein [Planctomycetota bacterium]